MLYDMAAPNHSSQEYESRHERRSPAAEHLVRSFESSSPRSGCLPALVLYIPSRCPRGRNDRIFAPLRRTRDECGKISNKRRSRPVLSDIGSSGPPFCGHVQACWALYA